jgi:hypothetical protein
VSARACRRGRKRISVQCSIDAAVLRSSSSVLPYADTPIRRSADPFPSDPFPLVLHHRISGHVGWELFAPMEERQFNHKKSRADDAADLLNQIHGSP